MNIQYIIHIYMVGQYLTNAHWSIWISPTQHLKLSLIHTHANSPKHLQKPSQTLYRRNIYTMQPNMCGCILRWVETEFNAFLLPYYIHTGGIKLTLLLPGAGCGQRFKRRFSLRPNSNSNTFGILWLQVHTNINHTYVAESKISRNNIFSCSVGLFSVQYYRYYCIYIQFIYMQRTIAHHNITIPMDDGF